MKDEILIKNTKISSEVIIASLEAAVPLALISSFIFALQITVVFRIKELSVTPLIAGVIYFLVQFFCFCLRYDKKLFKILLNNPESVECFDKTLNKLWNKKIIKNKTMDDRCKGTARLIKITFLLIFLQILVLCTSIIF